MKPKKNWADEADFNNECANFAGKYVENHYKAAGMVKKSLVMNSLAHGYGMGAKWAIQELSLVEKALEAMGMKKSKTVAEHCLLASEYYLKKMGMNSLPWEDVQLVKACIGVGFEEGARSRGKSDTTT